MEIPNERNTRLVVEGLCDGNPVQQCMMCREEVNVRKVTVPQKQRTI